MKTDSNTASRSLNLPRISKVCVTAAINRLRSRGFVGEAERARVTRDTTERHTSTLLADNIERIQGASLLRIVRSGRAFAYQVCLMGEIGGRK